jgi:Zn-dependent peptidase ImmA (M78 family)
LGAFGIERAYVRKKILPDWWDDDCTSTGAGFSELALRISRGLGLSLNSLLDDRSPIIAEASKNCKFKGKTRVNNERVVVGICQRAAELATHAAAGDFQRLVGIQPQDIRNEILAAGNKWVDLENLSNYCWQYGIPVLHITNFPKGVHKPDAMLIRVGDRPAIVICRNKKQPAWLLFDLAHELGHLIAGHVEPDGLIVDSDISDDSNVNEDSEEDVADRNALDMLTGDPDRHYRSNNRPRKASELAAICKQRGESDSVYPGHIVLNYIKGLAGEFHALGASTLSKLFPNSNASKVLHRCMTNHLDFSMLPEDHSEYLLRIVNRDGSAR